MHSTTSLIITSLFWLATCFHLHVVDSVPLEDLIEDLPLYGRPPTPQFSGLLDATDGCDLAHNGDVCKLHYWLALAEEEEEEEGTLLDEEDRFSSERLASKPVMLWLNGGPGSSGLYGFFIELGPLLINATGDGLHENPWSWTKVAHLLVLEVPVGVGYSYCGSQFDGLKCLNTDDFTASASRAGLVDFFNNKFPELKGNDFFLTGESYAGVYIPTLAKEILDNTPDGTINLSGMALGDPCLDNDAQADSMDVLWYGNKYGLVDEDIYDLLWNQCNVRAQTFMMKGGKHLVSAQLNHLVKEKKKELGLMEPEQYEGKKLQKDLEQFLRHKASVDGEPDEHDKHRRNEQLIKEQELRNYARQLLGDTIKELSNIGHTAVMSPDCQLAYRKFLLSTSYGLSQTWDELYIDDYSLFTPVATEYEDYLTVYMNRGDVKRALHVEEVPTDAWPIPTFGFDYTKEYSACNAAPHKHQDISMNDVLKELAPQLKTTWVFNGDTDPCVSYEGTRTAVKRIGFGETDGGGYRPWFYHQEGVDVEILQEKAPNFGPNLVLTDMGMQLGGEIVDYEHNLKFFTVHGAGHMVPQFRPQASLHLMKMFVKYEELSPPMPTNQTLRDYTESDFNFNILSQWTQDAKNLKKTMKSP